LREYDIVINAVRVATTEGVLPMDAEIQAGSIVALGWELRARRGIGSVGELDFPDGVDAQCHIEQKSSSGLCDCSGFMRPTGRPNPEFSFATSFGAQLL